MSVFQSFSPHTNLAIGKVQDYPGAGVMDAVLLAPATIDEFTDGKGDGTVFQLQTDEDGATNGNWLLMGWEFRIAGDVELPGYDPVTWNFSFDTGWQAVPGTGAQTPGRDFTYDPSPIVEYEFEAIYDSGTHPMAHHDSDNPPTFQDDLPTDIQLFYVVKGKVYFDKWRFIEQFAPENWRAWTEIVVGVYVVAADGDETWEYYQEAGGGGISKPVVAGSVVGVDLEDAVQVGTLIVTKTWAGSPPIPIFNESEVKIYGQGSTGGTLEVAPPDGALMNVLALDSNAWEIGITECALRSTEQEGLRDDL